MENIGVVGMFAIGMAFFISMVGSICGIAVAIQKLFFKQTDPNKEFVTREELERSVGELKSDITALENKMDRDIHDLRTDIVNRVGKLDDYVHQSHHQTLNSMQTMNLKIEKLLTFREIDMIAKNKRPEVDTE